MNESFSITNLTKGKPPRLPFVRIKEHSVGKKHFVSLVFAGDTRMTKLNKTYRGKNTIPNVLSFAIDNKEGEIFINLNQAKKDATAYKKSYNKLVGLLFVHGLLHLKGFHHGENMEKKENEIEKEKIANVNENRGHKH